MAALLPACGGSQRSVEAPSAELKDAIADIERRNRDTLRDLENQIVVLEDRLRSAERAPTLPVEVRQPDQDDADDQYEVAGIDEDGVEILYVGDAAEEHSVAIKRPARLPPPSLGEPDGMGNPASSVALRPSERLHVTGRTGPTVDQQLRAARTNRPARTARPAPSVLRQKVPRADSEPMSDDPKRQYKRAYGALRAGDHSRAIADFRRFLARYPDHDFSDNARYWLAEAFYDKRQYATALTEFHKVVADYPDGNKVPDAMLKMGYCYLALGKTERARSALTEVARRFPDSSPAKLATSRLGSLDK